MGLGEGVGARVGGTEAVGAVVSVGDGATLEDGDGERLGEAVAPSVADGDAVGCALVAGETDAVGVAEAQLTVASSTTP